MSSGADDEWHESWPDHWPLYHDSGRPTPEVVMDLWEVDALAEVALIMVMVGEVPQSMAVGTSSRR